MDDAAQDALADFTEQAYSLDFDDIAGGIPTRFRFRQARSHITCTYITHTAQVPANDFGLTAEEVAC